MTHSLARPHAPRMSTTFQDWASIPKVPLMLCTLAVFVTAWASITYTRQVGGVAVIWPSDAIILAFMLRMPRANWVPLLLAGFFSNVMADWIAADTLGVAMLLSACNSIEVVVSILLFSRFVALPPDLTRVGTFARFLLFCGLLGPAASALVGALVLGALKGSAVLPVFKSWFAADSLGVLTVTPLLLMLRTEEWEKIKSRSNLLQTLGIFALVAASTFAIFWQNYYPLMFLIFPFLIFAAFHLRFAGAAVAMGILAVISIPLTIMGHGPIVLVPGITFNERIVLLQLFLATVVFTVLPIAAVLTGRRRLERETVAARRAAERANAAKSAFLTNMSHELRTPMTGILGMCDLLLASEQTPEQKSMTETLERSARSFLELLNDLLDLAKIEAGRMDIDVSDFRVSQVMKDVQEFFAPVMSQKGLVFSVQCASADYDVLSGDPKRLRQVLFNLVGNALKFTDEGKVIVRCRQELQEDGTVLTEFEVRDTGIGMSVDAQSRLFKPFEQEDSSTSRRFGGTGLGLNISKQIVEAMGGSIGAQSSQGQGSLFFFSVRMLPGLAEKIERRFAITPARIGGMLKGQKLKILFAEDNSTTQFLVRQVMEMWGHTVAVVANGDQAVVKARGERFDIILMDMQMPVMDGAEAARVIRNENTPVANIPIIALTADAIPESRKRYLAAGCDAVVTKPIEWNVLAREMKLLVAGSGPSAVEAADDTANAHDAPPPIFDRQRIDGLSEGLGPALMAGLLARCLGSFQQYLGEVVSHVDEGDLAKVRRSAHDLKSACAQFGALKAGELARMIEAEMPDLETIKAALPELEKNLTAAAGEIQLIHAEMADAGPRAGRTAA